MDVKSGDVALRVMNDAVKNMIHEFRQLERPFLNPRGEVSDEEGYLNEDETDWLDYYRTNHRRCGLRERVMWLRTRSDVVRLLEALNRFVARRIAKEVGKIAMYVYIASLLVMRGCRWTGQGSSC
jgi:hypothetical protein